MENFTFRAVKYDHFVAISYFFLEDSNYQGDVDGK